MRIRAITSNGATIHDHILGHGEHPRHAMAAAGFAVTRPLSAARAHDGELELILEAVRHANHTPAAPSNGRKPPRDHDLVLAPGEIPVVKQRIAAYAVVRSSEGLLGTEYSDKTNVAGLWGLPGGGIDEGEDPVTAVHREVAEETSQEVSIGDLIDVHSNHWIGRGPDNTAEDFHAVRLIYAATCRKPTEPVVLDVGGTTASARWIPLDRWDEVPWTDGWHSLLKARVPLMSLLQRIS